MNRGIEGSFKYEGLKDIFWRFRSNIFRSNGVYRLDKGRFDVVSIVVSFDKPSSEKFDHFIEVFFVTVQVIVPKEHTID